MPDSFLLELLELKWSTICFRRSLGAEDWVLAMVALLPGCCWSAAVAVDGQEWMSMLSSSKIRICTSLSVNMYTLHQLPSTGTGTGTRTGTRSPWLKASKFGKWRQFFGLYHKSVTSSRSLGSWTCLGCLGESAPRGAGADKKAGARSPCRTDTSAKPL